MEFARVHIQNFMSFAKESIDFSKDGLILVEGVNHDEGGSNGSGKSTIWDAISWCLFGKTVRGLKDDAVMNRHYKKNCCVSVRLTARGYDYIIERNRNNGELGNRLYYMRNGSSVELGTVAMTQERLLEDLGIDFELFRCTVLFAQEETFNFVSASNKEQKEILSKVMKIDFDAHLETAKAKFRELDDAKEEIESKLMVLESHLDKKPKEIYQDEIDSWDEEIAKELEYHQQKAKEFRDQIAAQGPIGDYEAMAVVSRKLHSKIDEFKKEWRNWCEIASDMRQEAGIAEKEIEKFKDLAEEGRCHVCEQPIKGAHAASKCEDLTIERNKRKRDAEEAQEKAKEFDAKVAEYQEKLDKLKDKIREAQSKESERRALSASMLSHEEKARETRSKENPWIKKREEHIEKQRKIAEKIKALGEERGRIEADLPYYQFWVNAFGDAGIKSFVFDLICASLTEKTNRFLNVLTSGSVVVSFDTQKKLKSGEFREKFDCVVSSKGERVPYEAYSGGEKRKISLAVDMALATIMSEHYGSKFSLVVFDEQDRFMDKQGRENFMEMLKSVAKDRAVYVVAHDAEFKGLFDNVLTVEKRGGISRVV